jgi:hypothetical protein
MFFPTTVDVTRVWKQVVASVIDNRLGTSCKVGTDDSRDQRLNMSCVAQKGTRHVLILYFNSLRLHEKLPRCRRCTARTPGA